MVQNIFNYSRTSSLLVESLLESNIIKVQRVVAQGQASNPGVYCPQPDNDFLIMLKGQMDLDYEQSSKVSLRPEDFIVTTEGQTNRIDSTSRNEDSVWLKVNFMGQVREGLHPSPDLPSTNSAKIESIAETVDVRVERVTSRGQASASGVYCPQSDNEWLIMVKGQTTLEIGTDTVNLIAGDYVFIPSNTRNRVQSTSPNEDTVWVAVYFPGQTKGNYPNPTGY